MGRQLSADHGPGRAAGRPGRRGDHRRGFDGGDIELHRAAARVDRRRDRWPYGHAPRRDRTDVNDDLAVLTTPAGAPSGRPRPVAYAVPRDPSFSRTVGTARV